MKKKKQTRRGQAKYPALDPALNLKTRYELIDYDYLHKLSDKEKEWLNKFTEEYTIASFKKSPKKNLHKTKALRKDCYDRNNARNRDILTLAKASGKNSSWSNLDKENLERFDEDILIQNIDKKLK